MDGGMEECMVYLFFNFKFNFVILLFGFILLFVVYLMFILVIMVVWVFNCVFINFCF